jgi:hypothetical protein
VNLTIIGADDKLIYLPSKISYNIVEDEKHIVLGCMWPKDQAPPRPKRIKMFSFTFKKAGTYN